MTCRRKSVVLQDLRSLIRGASLTEQHYGEANKRSVSYASASRELWRAQSYKRKYSKSSCCDLPIVASHSRTEACPDLVTAQKALQWSSARMQACTPKGCSLSTRGLLQAGMVLIML